MCDSRPESANLWLRWFLVCAVLAVAAGPARAEPVGFQVDAARSYIVAVTHRAGFLGAVGIGHEHGIVATAWSASGCLDQENPAASRAIVTIPTASLRIDTGDARRMAGLASSGPSAKDVQEIQAKMMGPDNLAAQHYPEIRFATTAVRQTTRDALVLNGTLSIRGRAHNLSFPLKLERTQDGLLHFSGSVEVKQTDYGITPVSISGLVKVKDAVDVRFEIYAKPGAGCQ